MPLSTSIFDRISQTADFIANENLRKRERGEQREFQRQQQTEGRKFQVEQGEKQFQRSRLNQLVDFAMNKLDLEPGERAKLVGNLFKDPNFVPDPTQFQEQTFQTTERESPYFATGTRLPISRVSDIRTLHQAEPKPQSILVPLDENLARETGIAAGTKVPVTEYDALLNAVTRKKQMGYRYGDSKNLSGKELENAIDDTRMAVADIRRIGSPEDLSPDELSDLRFLEQRHRELLAEQDKNLGRKSTPEQKKPETPDERNKRLNALSHIRQWERSVAVGQLSVETYKQRIKDLHNQMGGDEKARVILKQIMGLK